MRGTVRRLLKLIAPFARWMALAVALGVATIISGVGLMTTSAYIIAKAALRPSIAELQVAIVAVRFFGIARGGFRYLERYVSHQVTFRLLTQLRVWFYTALEPLAPARLLYYRSGDLLSRIAADIGTLENFYLRVLAPPIVAFLSVMSVVFFVGSFDLTLAAGLLIFLLLAGVALPLLTQALSRPSGRRIIRVHTELNSIMVDGIQGVADLLAFGQETYHCERVHSLNIRFGRLQERMAFIGGLHTALSSLLMNLATLTILTLAIPLVRSGIVDGVFLALLVLAAISSFEAVLPLPQAFQYLENSLEAARRLFEIIDSEPAVVDQTEVLSEVQDPRTLPYVYGPGDESVPRASSVAPQVAIRTDLQVNRLSFSYHPGSALVLDEVSFDLPQGSRIAIVGPSGAGKTTLVRLLLRFWDYTSGQILLGGRNLREYGQEAVRQMMAVVSQDTHLFNTTVRENLLLSWPEAGETEMVQAARKAQIHDFVLSLPQGYDTWIGEQGVRLSGGQRQRLAIARALLKNAPILILDEPTSNLDALTERDIRESLETLMTGRTSLVITHHLAGLDAVDQILVFESGRIVERGDHRHLLAQDGLYRRMWDHQRTILALGKKARYF